MIYIFWCSKLKPLRAVKMEIKTTVKQCQSQGHMKGPRQDENEMSNDTQLYERKTVSYLPCHLDNDVPMPTVWETAFLSALSIKVVLQQYGVPESPKEIVVQKSVISHGLQVKGMALLCPLSIRVTLENRGVCRRGQIAFSFKSVKLPCDRT